MRMRLSAPASRCTTHATTGTDPSYFDGTAVAIPYTKTAMKAVGANIKSALTPVELLPAS